MNQTTSFGKAAALGIGSVLLSEILCLFISFTCAAFSVSFAVGRYISVLCTLGIHIGIMADFGVKMAKRDAVESRRDGKKLSALRTALLSMVTGIPALSLWILLLVLRLSNGFNFLPLYRFLNAPFFQLLTFACGEHTLATLPMSRLCVFAGMGIVPVITVFVSYTLAMRGESEKS